ncbi:MAG: class I SAM-dependent methyltransferase [Alphaproteobacteria bacterium]
MSIRTIGLDQALNNYVAACGDREHPVAEKLRAATAALPEGSMQISVEQGQMLAFLVKLIGASEILEVGTFCGYSALWMALALPANGRLTACDVSREWTAIGRRHWREAGVDGKINLRIGAAADTLAALVREGRADSFDLAFIDADKGGYAAYFEGALGLVRAGGLMVFDNTLRGGSVADASATDPGTQGMQAFNAKVAADPRVDRVLVPIGDGMTMVRRIA